MRIVLVCILLQLTTYQLATSVPLGWLDQIHEALRPTHQSPGHPGALPPVFRVKTDENGNPHVVQSTETQIVPSLAPAAVSDESQEGPMRRLGLPRQGRKYRLPPKPSRYHKAKVAHHAKYGAMKTAEAVSALPLHVGAGLMAAALAPIRAGREAYQGRRDQARRTLKHGLMAPFAGAATGAVDTVHHASIAVQDFGRVLKHGAAFPFSKMRDRIFGKADDDLFNTYMFKLNRAKYKRRKMEAGIFDNEVAHIDQLSGGVLEPHEVRNWREAHKFYPDSKLEEPGNTLRVVYDTVVKH